MATYFRLEICDVKNPNEETACYDLTNCTSAEDLYEKLSEELNCHGDDLNFDDAYFDAQEDFLLSLLKLECKGKIEDDLKDEVFDSISEIEDSNISLDIIEAAYNIHGAKNFDIVMNTATKKYIGYYSTEKDFADDYCEKYLNLEIPDILQGCIDWQRVWDSSLRHDHSENNGHYFID